MADSQYIIDIAAEFPAGPATVERLDALADKLTLGGRRSDGFRDAVARLTADLEAAKSASADAAAALAAGNDQYASLEKAAVSAAKALERAQAGGRFDPRAARAANDAQVALDAYASTLRDLEGKSSAAKAAQDGVARTLANVEKLGKAADTRLASEAQKYEKLQAAVTRIPGPVGRVASKLVGAAKAAQGLEVAFGGAEASSIVLAVAGTALVAVLAAVTAAAALGYAAFGALVVRHLDAARSAQLTREAFSALSAETAAGVASFDEIRDATGATDEQLIALTKQLRAAHVTAGEMPAALRAAAAAEAALGAGGAAEFVDQIKKGELGVKAFAAQVDTKFGGIVEKRMQGLSGLSARFSRLWAKLFDGLKLEPVLQGLSIIVGMFDQANPLARALALGFKALFDPISNNAVAAAYAIEAFALGVAIDVVKTYLFFRKYGDEIKNVLLGVTVALGAAGVAWAAVNASAVLEFGAVAASAVAAGAAAAAAWFVAAAPAIAAVAAIAAVGYAIGELLTHWSELGEGVRLIWSDLAAWFSGQVDAFTQIGSDLIMGLVAGVKSAVGAVVDAVKNAVGAAVDTAKDVLGIHSPSKVFAEIGDDTVAGYTGAVDAGTPTAQTSMSNLVAANPDLRASGALAGASSPAPAASSGTSSGARGKSIDLAGATFNFYGVKDAESARDLLSEAFTRLLEDDAISLTGAVPA